MGVWWAWTAPGSTDEKVWKILWKCIPVPSLSSVISQCSVQGNDFAWNCSTLRFLRFYGFSLHFLALLSWSLCALFCTRIAEALQGVYLLLYSCCSDLTFSFRNAHFLTVSRDSVWLLFCAYNSFLDRTSYCSGAWLIQSCTHTHKLIQALEHLLQP